MMPRTQTGKSVVFCSSDTLPIRREVSVSVIVHPDYDSHTTNNDIALLKLVEEVDLSIYTPACLPASSADYVGQTAKVYGGKIPFLPKKTFPRLGPYGPVRDSRFSQVDGGGGGDCLRCCL